MNICIAAKQKQSSYVKGEKKKQNSEYPCTGNEANKELKTNTKIL